MWGAIELLRGGIVTLIELVRFSRLLRPVSMFNTVLSRCTVPANSPRKEEVGKKKRRRLHRLSVLFYHIRLHDGTCGHLWASVFRHLHQISILTTRGKKNSGSHIPPHFFFPLSLFDLDVVVFCFVARSIGRETEKKKKKRCGAIDGCHHGIRLILFFFSRCPFPDVSATDEPSFFSF